MQGANYENLRRDTARNLGQKDFDGFGIGGAIEKSKLADIVRWVTEELPAGKPKHLLGISEPDDIFAAIAAGVDTFDCVSPTRVARNGAAYSINGRFITIDYSKNHVVLSTIVFRHRIILSDFHDISVGLV